MKTLLTILSLFSIQLGISQTFKLRYFDYNLDRIGLGSSELWLNNDSTFFLLYADCTSSELSKGAWTKFGDSILLYKLTQDESKFQLTAQTMEYDADSLTIYIKDIYGYPAKNCLITLFNDSSKSKDLYSDVNGEIVVPRNEYTMFTTQFDEINYVIGTSFENCLHKIGIGASKIIITINYPSELLRYRNYPKIINFIEPLSFGIGCGNTLINKERNLVFKRKNRQQL